jgi:hypothetical protein
MIAAELEVDPHQLHTVLERHVRDHIAEQVRPNFADHHREMLLMLKALRDRPLMVGTAEVLVDAARYITTVQLVLMGAREGRALKQHR